MELPENSYYNVTLRGETAMFCGNCGHVVPSTNNFCSRCGQPVNRDFTTEEVQGIFVIEANVKNIDYTNHGEITSIFNRARRKRIVIDLTKVEFIDSTGIGTLVTLYYKTNRTKQHIIVVGVQKEPLKAMKALGVDNLIEIVETRDKAFAEWGITSV